MIQQSKTFNIYCDESGHLENDKVNVMGLGAIWCNNSIRKKIFHELKFLKTKHDFASHWELKWNAVSPQRIDYYEDLIDYFFDNDNLFFRGLIVPDKAKLNHQLYRQSHDEFYYKMYFDMLKAILEPSNVYRIFLDIKDTNGIEKVKKLRDVLCFNMYDFDNKIVEKIEEVRSHQVELVQLADFFIGAVVYANRGLTTSDAKLRLIQRIRDKSGYTLTKTTLLRESKFNILIWEGGLGR